MNIVVLGNKHKSIQAAVRNENFNILGWVTGNDVVKQICDVYNPNILLVRDDGGKNRELFIDVIEELKGRLPELRVIYLYGAVTSKQDFIGTVARLLPYSIYDICFDVNIDQHDFPKKLRDILKYPSTRIDLENSIKMYQERTKVLNFEEEIIQTSHPVNIRLTEEVLQMDNNEIIRNEQPDEQIDKKNFSVSVFSALSTSDTTAIAIELGVWLSQVQYKVAIAVTKIDFEQLSKFYRHTGVGPIRVQNLDIYHHGIPAEKYDFEINVHRNLLSADNNDDIKIAVLQPYEWTASINADMISTLPFSSNVNYLFYPAGKQAFKKFAKQFARHSLKAYRLECSPNVFSPCENNKAVYSDIVMRYTQTNKAIKKRYR